MVANHSRIQNTKHTHAGRRPTPRQGDQTDCQSVWKTLQRQLPLIVARRVRGRDRGVIPAHLAQTNPEVLGQGGGSIPQDVRTGNGPTEDPKGETGNPAQGIEAGIQSSRRRRGKTAQRLQPRRPSKAVILSVDVIAQKAGDIGAPRCDRKSSSM